MAGTDNARRRYGDADGYDLYMGGWSAALAPLFLDFVGLAGGTLSIVDVGCGTGNLLTELARRFPGARLTGIDPSPALLGKARRRPELARAALLDGALEELAPEAGGADAVLSMLVLQEFADRGRALAAMARLVRPGGIVAACQWDFSRMPVIDALVAALAAVDPQAGAHVSSSTPAAFSSVPELAGSWTAAGFTQVRAGRIAVTRGFASFDDLWRPLLAGSTPSTLMLASLPSERRAAVHDSMRARLGANGPGDAIDITAEALVVAGLR